MLNPKFYKKMKHMMNRETLNINVNLNLYDFKIKISYFRNINLYPFDILVNTNF